MYLFQNFHRLPSNLDSFKWFFLVFCGCENKWLALILFRIFNFFFKLWEIFFYPSRNIFELRTRYNSSDKHRSNRKWRINYNWLIPEIFSLFVFFRKKQTAHLVFFFDDSIRFGCNLYNDFFFSNDKCLILVFDG